MMDESADLDEASLADLCESFVFRKQGTVVYEILTD
jgi:hypothetical protein